MVSSSGRRTRTTMATRPGRSPCRRTLPSVVECCAPATPATCTSSSAESANEHAERVAGEVGEHVERLLLVVGPVQQEPGAERLRALTVPLELGTAADGEVEVQLHRHLVRGPRRGGQ